MTFAHYFIALSLKQHVSEQLGLWQKQLKEQLAYKQWTHEQDLHVTLKFLGGVSSEQLAQLKSGLHEIEKTTAFQMHITGLSYFGNPNKPRVLFADVVKSKALEHLQSITEQIAENCGFPKEKRLYHPHITLAKKYNGKMMEQGIQQLQKQYENKTFDMFVNEVVLYEIHPQKQPKYVKYATYQLKL